MADHEETRPEAPKFDFAAYPEDTLFHDRRTGLDRRGLPIAAPVEAKAETVTAPIIPLPYERRARKERRRRVDPTTFEKQYSDEEMEFMNAMQRFKVQSGKPFPTHGEVLRIAFELGYRKTMPGDNADAAAS